jgi:hypothetical protein
MGEDLTERARQMTFVQTPGVKQQSTGTFQSIDSRIN